MGGIGFAYHFSELRAGESFPYGAAGIEILRLTAVVSGVFLLRGADWARWIAIVWIGFHVVLSIFHTLPELAVHCLFFGAIAWLLCRRDSGQYFRPTPA